MLKIGEVFFILHRVSFLRTIVMFFVAWNSQPQKKQIWTMLDLYRDFFSQNFNKFSLMSTYL